MNSFIRRCWSANRRWIFFIVLTVLISCGRSAQERVKYNQDAPAGELIIFHAGSLSAPMKEISRQFETENPGVKVLLEAAGSVDCARKITELKKPCDLMASSDYKVIENYLIPHYTGWHIPFAANEMVIAFTERSRKAGELSKENWVETMLQPEVHFGKADPHSDPCGYRTVLVFKLAEKYYDRPGLTKEIISKDGRYIRPKEVDLLALLEVGEIDYIFIYRSVAIQHQLKFLELPEEINLKSPAFSDRYHEVSIRIPGNQPGDSVQIYGEPMVYSITMLDQALNKVAAMAFLDFLLRADKGLKVVEEMGQRPVVPAMSPYFGEVPESLRKYVTE